MDSGIVGVLGTVLGVLIAGPLTYHFSKILVTKTHDNSIDIMRRQEYCKAASKFRATVIYELSGFYPLGQYWDEKEFPRLYNSIPRIMSAAAEFRFFVNSEDEFDATVKKYDEYCRMTTYQAVTNYGWFPMSFPQTPDENPKVQFNIIVGHLLSFADNILMAKTSHNQAEAAA